MAGGAYIHKNLIAGIEDPVIRDQSQLNRRHNLLHLTTPTSSPALALRASGSAGSMMLSHAFETSMARICFFVTPAAVRREVVLELLRVPSVAESLQGIYE